MAFPGHGGPRMQLRKLFSEFDPAINLSPVPDLEILGIREDSRKVKVGDLFIARAGTKTDGAKFVADPAARGAVAVVADHQVDGCALPQIKVTDSAAAASLLAQAYHGWPSRKVRVIGVTGTNGKTTTTYLVRHLLQKVRVNCGLVGTVQIY